MAEWVEFMEQEVVPFQISKGMLITGMYRGEQDDSLYVWMGGLTVKRSGKRSTKQYMKAITGRTRLARESTNS